MTTWFLPQVCRSKLHILLHKFYGPSRTENSQSTLTAVSVRVQPPTVLWHAFQKFISFTMSNGRLRSVMVAHRTIQSKNPGSNPGGDRLTYISSAERLASFVTQAIKGQGWNVEMPCANWLHPFHKSSGTTTEVSSCWGGNLERVRPSVTLGWCKASCNP